MARKRKPAGQPLACKRKPAGQPLAWKRKPVGQPLARKRKCRHELVALEEFINRLGAAGSKSPAAIPIRKQTQVWLAEAEEYIKWAAICRCRLLQPS